MARARRSSTRIDPCTTTGMIHIDKLTVRFGKFVAVDELSLDADAGQVFGLSLIHI